MLVAILASSEFPANETDSSDEDAKRRNYFSIAGGFVAVVGAGVVPFGIWLQTLGPILAFAWLIARTTDTLVHAIDELNRRLRALAGFALILAATTVAMVIVRNLSGHAPAMALLAVPILLIIQHPVTSRLAVGLGSFSWLVWVGSVLTSIGVEAVYEVRWGWSLYLALLICSLAVVILRAAKAFWFLDRPLVGVRRAIETN